MEVYQYLIPTVKQSPGTIYPNFSRIVNDHGVIEYGFDDNGGYVNDSYGRSPDREVDNCSCTINSSGEAYWSYFATVTSYSYGHIIAGHEARRY